MNLGSNYPKLNDHQKILAWAGHFHLGLRMAGDDYDASPYDFFHRKSHEGYLAYEPDFDRLLPGIAAKHQMDLATVRQLLAHDSASPEWKRLRGAARLAVQVISDGKLALAGRIELAHGDLTTQRSDAIVNAAGPALDGSGGLDAAVHRAGGERLVAECRALRRCGPGAVVVTGGHDLPARWVIHAVGPVWKGGGDREEEILARAYRQALQVALTELAARTVAFPSISTGSYGFPVERAARIAITTVRDFLERCPAALRVRFVLRDPADHALYRRLLDEILGPGVAAPAIDRRDRVLGGIWGAVVADALGVPVEFKDRELLRRDPVTDLREYGTHKQPRGTWSDDSSLLLCTAESLSRSWNTTDLGARFVRWSDEGYWGAHREVFDIGMGTANAIRRIADGTPPEEAGGDDERSNGNGSLMRILPVALAFAHLDEPELLDRVHRASALTHRHPRSQIACGLYSLAAAALLDGATPRQAYARAVAGFDAHYQAPRFAAERPHFERFLSGRIDELAEAEVRSGTYVMHSIEASFWILLGGGSYEEMALRAVNLGDDSDTTACILGGLAGVHLGLAAVPERWRRAMAREGEIADLAGRFAEAIERRRQAG